MTKLLSMIITLSFCTTVVSSQKPEKPKVNNEQSSTQTNKSEKNPQMIEYILDSMKTEEDKAMFEHIIRNKSKL